MADLELAREDLVRAALALVRARQSSGLTRAQEQRLERALEAAAARYWGLL